jgi:hypothetical protein
MNRYPVTFLGKKFSVNGSAFVLIMLTLLVLWVISLMGIFKFGGWLAILAAILLTSSVTARSKQLTLIPHPKVLKIASFVVFWAGVFYYFFG